MKIWFYLHRVSDIESHRMSQVQFALSYQVSQTDQDKARDFERQLAAAVQQSERSASDGLVYVNTDPLVAFFGRMRILNRMIDLHCLASSGLP
jgi:hypothetical protein